MSYDNLSHTRWEHIYHVDFIPYCRKKVLYGKIRAFLGPKVRELALQRGSEILEGHAGILLEFDLYKEGPIKTDRRA